MNTMFKLNPQPHWFFLLIFGLFSYSVQSLRFELESGQTKCITEDIRKSSMTVGNYSIINPNVHQPLPDSHTVSVRVGSLEGSKIYHESDHVQSGQFSFVAGENGDHIACFWVGHQKPQVTLTIDLDWRTGVAAKDWSNVAKKSHVDGMVRQLQILQEVASSIHEETVYLRKQEQEMELHNWTTNTRILWLCLLSFFVCMSVAGLQLWHLKTFFEKKKIL
ncbi:Transmembrane emp24 domain-containing protein [Vigna angularis]|uniref:Transmembrane emp24 domain-containing protein n=2 Tax=Phaseolus angularis TaxID=3914 RepID=A0A8T0JMR2_PHAAN|nr:transmembrane emp24 domain-containing protein p24delta7 [Vigna angularis]KAG2376990.1 Transmembrane emp24 domain-containing protein [Vigna angularis]